MFHYGGFTILSGPPIHYGCCRGRRGCVLACRHPSSSRNRLVTALLPLIFAHIKRLTCISYKLHLPEGFPESKAACLESEDEERK